MRERILALIVVGVALTPGESAWAEDVNAILLQLKSSVSPPTLTDTLTFGIASLDSIGSAFDIRYLSFIVGNPAEVADEYPEMSRIYCAACKTSANVDSVTARYVADPHIEYVEVDTSEAVFYSDVPDDDLIGNQWQLNNAGASQHPCFNGVCSDSMTDIVTFPL